MFFKEENFLRLEKIKNLLEELHTAKGKSKKEKLRRKNILNLFTF